MKKAYNKGRVVKISLYITGAIEVLVIIYLVICGFFHIFGHSEEPKYEIDEIAIEYEQEIMPDGLYLYYVDGSYMTVGIMTTGRTNDGKRAGRASFYAVTEYGDVSSSYETIFIEDRIGGKTFTCVGRNYSLEFQDCGRLYVIQTADYEDLGTVLGFAGDYVYTYTFNEFSVTERIEND